MDINNDGIDDIISGEYSGRITLFKGIKGGGVHPPVEVEQKLDIRDGKNVYQVVYANPYFGDYNGDGLLDAFVGGAKGMRVMLNIGTKESPIFDVHQPILGIDGKQIYHREITARDLRGIANKNFIVPDYQVHIYFVDWDNDGINDILTTTSYCDSADEAICFHKGVITDDGLRFNKSVPLFTAITGGKSLTVKSLRVSIVDTNKDGTLDIILGFSGTTDDNGDYIPELNNLYEYDEHTYGLRSSYSVKNNVKQLGTRGFVIILLGKKHYK